MAFLRKAGSILRQTVSKQISSEISASNPSIFQIIRCMSSSKLFIGGLSYSTDETSLTEAFAKYGAVVETRVIMDRETGRSRGFGFVTYTSSEEASSAIQALDGQDLHGRMIKVNYANDRPRNPGFGGGGAYGGGDGGYGGGGGGGYGSGGGGYGGNNYGGGGGGDGGYGASGGGYTSTGGGYGGNNYGGASSGDGGYGASGGGYTSTGGGYGGNQSFDVASGGSGSGSGDAGTGFPSTGYVGYVGNTGLGCSGGNQFGSQDAPHDGNLKDDDDDAPDDYANRRA